VRSGRFNARDWALNVLRAVRPEIARQIISAHLLRGCVSFAEMAEAFRRVAAAGVAGAEAGRNLREGLNRYQEQAIMSTLRLEEESEG